MKRILFSTVFLCITALLAGFIFNSPDKTTSTGFNGTFRTYLSSEPSNLDPARGVDVNEGTVQAKIFDGLVRYDEEMKLVGDIAKSWSTSPDGKTYTFKLNKNIKFHNGQLLTAKDVVYSLNRLLDPKVASPRSWVLEKVQGAKERLAGKSTNTSGIKAIDDYTVEIKLAEAFAPFISLLTMPAGYILPSNSAKAISDKSFFEKPAGTGPYKIVERVRDSYIKLTANENYFGKKPLVSEIEIRIIPESMKAEMDFESGNLDMLQLYPSNYDRFKAKKEYSKRIHNIPAMNTFYIGFNNQKAPFNNVKVRKALNMLVDRQKIIDAVFNGRAVAAKGSIPPGISGYRKDLEGYKFNPEGGKLLLEEAGYTSKKPLEFELFQKSSQAAFEITRLLQGELRKQGVIVHLRPMEWSALKDSINKGEAPAFYLSWFGDYPDGENFLNPLFNSKNWGSGGNRARFSNKEIDKMLEKAITIQDADMRDKAYAAINRKIVDQAPWLYLWHSSESYLLSNRVTNMTFSPLFSCDKGLTVKIKN